MSEKDEELFLIDTLIKTGLFTIYNQVFGRCYHIDPHNLQGKNTSGIMCIDIIAMPTKKAISEGWSYGPIGIEAKDINIKMGPGLSQCIDYKNSLWELDKYKWPNLWINLKYVFYYPMEPQSGLIASIMAQNRIGTICKGHHSLLKMNFSSFGILRIEHDMTYKINTSTTAGMKLGSR